MLNARLHIVRCPVSFPRRDCFAFFPYAACARLRVLARVREGRFRGFFLRFGQF